MTPRVWKAVWQRLQEPKTVTVLTSVYYLACMIVGFDMLAIPDVDGPRDLMAALFILGGTLALLGCPFGQWWLERLGLIGLMFAVAMRIVYIAASPYEGWLQHLMAAGVLVLLLTRWIRIRVLPVDPLRASRSTRA